MKSFVKISSGGLFCLLLTALLFLKAPVTALASIGIDEEDYYVNRVGARVLLSDWSILNNDVSDGTVRLLITLENPNPSYNASNIVITYTCEQGVYPEYGTSNQLYIDRIAVEQSVSREITLRMEDAASAFLLNFSLEYIDGRSGNAKNQFVIGGLLDEITRAVQISSVTALSPVDESGEAQLSLSLKNVARFDAHDVRLIIRDTSQQELARIEMGDIASGGILEREVTVTMPEIRAQRLLVSAVYADQNGNEYTTREEQLTLYQAQSIAEEQDGASDLTNGQLMQYGLAAVLILVVLALLLIPRLKTLGRLLRRRK